MHDLQLITAGRTFAGWKTMRISRGMEQCAGTFELGVTELWPGQDLARRIQPGEPCKVVADGERVITGYVDEVSIDEDEKQHTVGVNGRDATADLVDCSAIRKTGQWRGLKVEQIAQELAAPFGIKVRAAVDTGKPLSSFAIQEGETVFEALERAARIRALLLLSDGTGGLLITRAGLNRISTALVMGDNILSISGTLSMRDRFSQYYVKGQAAGTDFFNAHAAAQMKASAFDPGVPRYRPLVITAEAQDLATSLTRRAQWEANVRAARSTDIKVKVQGWSHAGGVWQPNTIVHVTSAPMRLDDDLLIKSVTLSLDEKGSTAELALTRADAFTLLPVKDPGAVGAFWSLPKPAQGAQ